VAPRPWTCQKCRRKHPSRVKQLCVCGARRPKTRRPAHMKALDLPYETFVELNGGEHCGICGLPPLKTRRHDRDHDHLTGKPRGILCPTCNGFLTARIGRSSRALTPDFLRRSADYLERCANRG
jgi:hypothetical protein